ncbi:MAG TPA: glycosyltransferase family 39 protein [Candidatus Polarisedimenticolaceae bacterium]|nr:glycosyltransferase family 39 protein [Candidatus Polarisedimenticolaceae bacterium]
MRGQAPFSKRGLTLFLPLAAFAFFAATVHGYGVFRDELYYIACARHLDWGYVDHPPLVALIAAVFGPSWVVLRVVSAAAFAATILLVGDTAKEMGGGTFARIAAQLLAATAPIYLSLFSIYSMNAIDVLVWAALARIMARLLTGGDPRWWVAFGAVAGIGLQNKVDVGLLGVSIVVGLLLARRFELFRTRWIWIGGALAAALFAPHVLWQITHGFPTREFVANAQRHKIAGLSALGFLGSQIVMAGPPGCVASLAGLGWLFGSRTYRALGWAVLAVLAMLAFSVSKPYYFSPTYTILFPAGGVAVEAWTRRRFTAPLRAGAIVLILSVLIAAPLAKPLLSEDRYVRYAEALGVSARSDENHRMGRLPQFFADMHGWEEMARSVAHVVEELSPADRARACVYGQNYGEAAAIDYFRPSMGLPPAISGHNSYWMWGTGACSGELIVIIGGDREDHLRSFASVEDGGAHVAKDAMPYENDLTIWIARGLKVPLKDAWVASKHYD